MAYADGKAKTSANYAGSPAPDANQPGNDVVNTSPNNQAPMTKNGSVHPDVKGKALGVLHAIGTGQLAGVHVPADAPKLKSDVTPKQVQDMGIGIYKPKSKDVSAVFFNPGKVPVTTLKALDAKNRLAHAFPSITKFLGISSSPSGAGKSGVGTPGKNTSETGAAGPAGASTGTPSTGAGQTGGTSGADYGQQGRNTPSISDLNLTGTPTPTAAAVPVLPRPGMGAGANAALASKRAAAVNGPPASAMQKPSSSIVSGLWRAPV